MDKQKIIKESNSLTELLHHLEEFGADNATKAIEVENYLKYQSWKKGIPFIGKFELTPLCNLNCKMCYVHLLEKQMNDVQLLSVEKWKRLMREAANMGMMIAVLTGGECLIYPGFEELYLYLQDLGVQIVVMTNGVSLSKEKIAFFNEHPPKIIQISLYGSNEDTYEKVTGSRQFENVIKTIHRVKEANLPLQIAITPNVFLKDNIKDLVTLVNSLSIPYNISPSLFDPYEETGRKGKQIDMTTNEYIDIFKHKASLEKKNIHPTCIDDYDCPDIIEEQPKGLSCGAGRNGFVITWDGIMQPCSMLRHLQQFPLDTNFKSCWEELNKIAMNYVLPIECNGCQFRKVCKQCVAQHAIDTPIGHASQSVCKYTKEMLKAGLIKFGK